MTRVLVTTASKHGTTAEIGAAVAERLAVHDLEVDALVPEAVTEVAAYDVAVIGSAVYAGRWRRTARDFVARFETELGARPVWLFSSGPLGDPPEPDVDPVDVADIMEATGAVEHRLFPGKLELSRLGFGERAIVAALRAPSGDYRSFEEIRAWADQIAAHITGDVDSKTVGRP